MEPDITVLVRTHNSQRTVETALRSVRRQTINPVSYSILVVDDGSYDRSVEVVREFPEATIIETNGVGPVAALNVGLKNVDTRFVIFLDSDDWFEPTILEAMYDSLKGDSEIDFVYSDYYEVIDSNRRVVSVQANIFNTIAAGIMFSTDTLRSCGFYDETLIFPEYDLLIKLLPKSTLHYIAEPLYNYVRRPGSITSDKDIVRKGILQLFERYGRYFPIREY